jgi:hypothetical protein
MPETSPTGTPIISPRVVPYLALVGAVLAPIAAELQDPAPWDMRKAGKLLALMLPGVLGILSPGLRKADGNG